MKIRKVQKSNGPLFTTMFDRALRAPCLLSFTSSLFVELYELLVNRLEDVSRTKRLTLVVYAGFKPYITVKQNNNKYLIRHYPRTADTADIHTKLHTNTNCRSQKPVANNQSNIKTDNQSKEEHAV